MSADVVAKEAADANVEAVRIVYTPVDAETANVEAADAGEEKPMSKR